MYTLSYIIDVFTEFLYAGFRVTLPVLILLFLLWKKQSAFWLKLIVTSNMILLTAAVISGLKYLIDLITFTAMPYETNAFLWRVMGPYLYVYWLTVIGQLLLPHLLWWKKYRWRYGISLLLLFATSIDFVVKMMILYSRTYSSYLPSSWVYYGPGNLEILVGFASYGLLLCCQYFVLNKYTGLLVKPEPVLLVKTDA